MEGRWRAGPWPRITGTKDQIPVVTALSLFHGNRFVLANLNAALASQTLFSVDRLGLFVFQLKNLHWADFNAFAAASALVLIHSWCEHAATPPFFIISTPSIL
jgi:hypothetical protein